MKSTYNYTALTQRGEIVSDTILAESEANAITLLREQGLYPTSINRQKTNVLKSTETYKPNRRTISIPLPIINLPKIRGRDFFMMSVGALISIVILSLLHA